MPAFLIVIAKGLVSVGARVFIFLKPFIYEWLFILVQKIWNKWKARREAAAKEKALKESMEREKEAKTKEEQENAFKDVVDKSRH